MSYHVESLCSRRVFGSAVRKQIIMYMAARASDDGTGIWCSKQTIWLETELSQSSVKRTIREFISEGILKEAGTKPCYVDNRYVGETIDYTIIFSAVEKLPEIERKAHNNAQSMGGQGEPGSQRTRSRETSMGGQGDLYGGSGRTPNNPNKITYNNPPPSQPQKNEKEEEDFVKYFDLIWGAYPEDRRRNQKECLNMIQTALRSGTNPEDILKAVKIYAMDSQDFTRSKVSYSDNWFREKRWERYADRSIDEVQQQNSKPESGVLNTPFPENGYLKYDRFWLEEARRVWSDTGRSPRDFPDTNLIANAVRKRAKEQNIHLDDPKVLRLFENVIKAWR